VSRKRLRLWPGWYRRVTGRADPLADAAKTPDKGYPTTDQTLGMTLPPGRKKAGPAALWGSGGCTGSFNPTPQYSASNKTIHWGGIQQCTKAVAQHLTVNLYAIVGTGDNERNLFQDQIQKNGVIEVRLHREGELLLAAELIAVSD